MKKWLGLLFFMSSFAQAGVWHDVTNFQLWSNAYTAPQIRIGLSSSVEIKNPSACPGDSNTIDSYMVNDTLPTDVKQRIYSTLLAAVVLL